jgi:hypothetical protein
MTQTSALPTAAPAASVDRNLSIIALVLGLASVVFGQTFLVPIAAIIVGVMAYRREPGGRAMAVWAIVLGAVMAFDWVVVGVLGLVFAAPFFFFGLF